MKIVKVVCGIIWKDGKIFIARRKPDKTMGGFWEFPGGKIEPMEDPEKALARELQEELGMVVHVENYLGTNLHHYQTFSIELIGFNCTLIYYEDKLIDHDQSTFVESKELHNYNLAPADVYFINLIK